MNRSLRSCLRLVLPASAWVFAGATLLTGAAAAAPVQLTEPGPFPEIAVAHEPGGGYLLFWQDFDSLELRARRVDAAGFPIGGIEHLLALNDVINTPRAAVSAAGTRLVLWVAGAGADQVGVLGAVFDAAGTVLRTFQLPEPVPEPQNAIGVGPSLAARPGGGFVAAWTIGTQEDPLGDPLNPSDTDAYALRLDDRGEPVGAPVRVNEETDGFQSAAGVAASETSLFVTWKAAGGDGMLSAYDADLAPAGPAVLVDPEAGANRPVGLEPVALPDGRGMVLWDRLADLPVLPPAERVLLRIFGPSGAPLSDPLDVDPVPARSDGGGSIGLTGEGVVWVSWLVAEGSPTSGQAPELEILARPFDLGGSPSGPPEPIATLAAAPVALTAGDQGALLSWRPAPQAPVVLGEVVGRPLDLSLPPDELGLVSPALPGFRVWVRISSEGTDSLWGTETAPCLADALCVAGRLPDRTESIVRVIGPRPNGFLWPVVTKLTPSRLEVWMEQLATGAARFYLLPGSTPGSESLPGLFDRTGFEP